MDLFRPRFARAQETIVWHYRLRFIKALAHIDLLTANPVYNLHIYKVKKG